MNMSAMNGESAVPLPSVLAETGCDQHTVRFHIDKEDQEITAPDVSPSAAAATVTPDGVSPVPVVAPATLGLFERWLSVWVALSMIIGTTIGATAPSVARALNQATVAEISLPVAILVWLMIFPMTLRIDFASLKHVALHPRSLLITLICNWAFQPFLMFGLALLFFRVAYSNVLNVDTQKQVGATRQHRAGD